MTLSSIIGRLHCAVVFSQSINIAVYCTCGDCCPPHPLLAACHVPSEVRYGPLALESIRSMYKR